MPTLHIFQKSNISLSWRTTNPTPQEYYTYGGVDNIIAHIIFNCAYILIERLYILDGRCLFDPTHLETEVLPLFLS